MIATLTDILNMASTSDYRLRCHFTQLANWMLDHNIAALSEELVSPAIAIDETEAYRVKTHMG